MTDKNKKSLHVKTGDRVVVTSGKDKGKMGSIRTVKADKDRVVVEGVNVITKAVRPNPAAGIQGGLTKLEAPIESSKVMLVCPSTL